MTQSVPDDGLSAFFDEELSPSELKEVAHHLSRSAAAQSELADIRRLSEELRALPQAHSPHSLLSGIMQEIDGKAIPSSASWDDTQSVRWPIGKIIAAALVLGLGIAVIPSLWNALEPANTESLVAARESGDLVAEPSHKAATDTGLSTEPKAERPIVRHLGTEGELLSQANRARPQANATGFSSGGTGELKSSLNEPSPPPLPMSVAMTETPLPQPASEGDNLRPVDPEMKGLMESATRAEERIVVLELTVEDAESTLERLQTLLAQNSVAAADFGNENSTTEEKQKRSGADSPLALFVQSTPKQLATALQSLQTQEPGSQVGALTNLALGDVLVRDALDAKAEGKDQTENEAAQTLAQVLAKFESRQLGGGFGGATVNQRAMSFADDPKADDRASRAAKSQPGLDNVPSVASANLGTLLQPGGSADGQAGQASWRSYQFVLPAPKDAWKQDPANQPEGGSAKKPAAGIEATRGSELADQLAEPAEAAKEIASPKPIRTLFLFRSKSQPPGK